MQSLTSPAALAGRPAAAHARSSRGASCSAPAPAACRVVRSAAAPARLSTPRAARALTTCQAVSTPGLELNIGAQLSRVASQGHHHVRPVCVHPPR
jgi:hypothetical protein